MLCGASLSVVIRTVWAATLLSSVALSGHCAGFMHPGTPLTLSDLTTLKTYVDQGRQPWKSAYDQLANDGKAKTAQKAAKKKRR